ncbi:hypothetical protein AX14_004513 [Amanita brunnescens Koide BX004]|nr:hypothetical protein AX14_004513 [Amanita brunnescens Koide BX004]
MSGSNDIDYAFLEGYRSMPAAIVFALLYAPLAVFFIRFLFIRLDRPVISMVLFCLIRTTAFIIRAVLIGNKTAGENLGLYIGDQVLFSIGFFGLLLAAYEVVSERTQFVEKSYFDSGLQHAAPRNPFIHLARNNNVFRAALMAALIIGIIGVSDVTSTNKSTASTGETLRKVSTVIFLILTILQALNTFYLVKLELSDQGIRFPQNAKFGARSGSSILAVISILLLVREIFITATINNSKVVNNEHFWYPLVAVPEFVSVTLYLIPGILPPKETNYSSNYSK